MDRYKPKFERKIAIVIPSLNRWDLWSRQVQYYADLKYRHGVYVGDSSEHFPINFLSKDVAELKTQVGLEFQHLPGLDDMQAISKMLHTSSETYAAFCGDDDFFVPQTMDQCVEFLEDNPDYSGAHGVAAYCATKSGDGYGSISWATPYRLPALELPTASARLTSFLSNNFESIFSLRRTAEFRKDIDATLDMPDKGFRDLTVCCLPIIHGKIKRIESFYLMRTVHNRQYLINGAYEWITSPGWSDSCQLFLKCVSEELSIKDRISISEARYTLECGFANYLKRILNQNPAATGDRARSGGLSRLRKVIDRIPGSRGGKHFLKSIRSPELRKVSLSALLNPSSPYHVDFIPIYRAITESKRGHYV